MGLITFFLFLPIALLARPAFQMQKVRDLFANKQVAEAIPLIKSASVRKEISAAQMERLGQWMATFQYDTTLGLFEKTAEEMTSARELATAEAALAQGLEKEPFQSSLLTHYIGVLLSQNKFDEAKKKIDWAITEMPFLEIYAVYADWLALKKGPAMTRSKCQHRSLSSEQRDFCHYVKFLEKLQATSSPQPTREILALSQKTSLPHRYWDLWKKWQKPADQQKYLSSCQTMSGKQKKSYLFVPELCSHKEKELIE